jgi:hypothetical protein
MQSHYKHGLRTPNISKKTGITMGGQIKNPLVAGLFSWINH